MKIRMLVAIGMLMAASASAATKAAAKPHSTPASRAQAKAIRANLTGLTAQQRAEIAAASKASRATLTAVAKVARANLSAAAKAARAQISADAIYGNFAPGVLGHVGSITITMQADGTILLTNK